MKKMLIALFTLTLTTNFVLANERKIKHCGSGAEKEMEAVLSFLDKNIEKIMDNVSDLTSKEKDKIRKKLSNLNYKCMDHKNVCQNHDDRGGVSRHIFNAAVVICYNRIRSVYGNNAFCGLADVVLHETGHAAGVEKDKGHNDGPNNDRVYRLGYAADDVCEAKGKDRSIAYNTND